MARNEDGAVQARLALTTVPDADCAQALARRLVEAGVAGCVQWTQIRSVYRWRGAVHDEPECLLLMKTTDRRIAELERAVCADHPYDTPEFLALDAGAGERYLHWLAGAVS